MAEAAPRTLPMIAWRRHHGKAAQALAGRCGLDEIERSGKIFDAAAKDC